MSDTFSSTEYDRRWTAVLNAVASRGLDALAVTTHSHIRYLTGHDAGGAYAAPYLLLCAPLAPRSMVVRSFDIASVRAESIPLELSTYFSRRDATEAFANLLEASGLASARIGLELDHWGLAPADVDRLRSRLPRATFVDATRAVTAVAERKSPEELEVMRDAASVTDAAIDAFRSALAPGVTESEVEAAVDAAVASQGSETRGMTLLFGERTAMPHGHAGDRRLRDGDAAFIEVSGFRRGYAAGLCRTALLGRDPDVEELHDLAVRSSVAAIEALRPGVEAGEVDRAAREVVMRAGREATFRLRCGYAIGIDWYDRGYMSLEPGATEVIEEGMTFHMPRILFDERERFGVGTSQTVEVTNDGAVPFSRHDMELFVVP